MCKRENRIMPNPYKYTVLDNQLIVNLSFQKYG